MVVVVVGEDQQVQPAAAQGLDVGGCGVPRVFGAAAVDHGPGGAGGHHHALPLAHIQQTEGQVMALGLVDGEEDCRRQCHRAGPHRQGDGEVPVRVPVDPPEAEDQHPVDKDNPPSIEADVQPQGRQAPAAGRAGEPVEVVHRQGHHRGQRLPQGREESPGHQGHRPAQKGQHHRPFGAEVGQGGDQGKLPKVQPRKGNGEYHGRQAHRGAGQPGGGPFPPPFRHPGPPGPIPL